MYTRFSGKRQKNKMEINKRKFYRTSVRTCNPNGTSESDQCGSDGGRRADAWKSQRKVLSGASLAGQIQFVMTLILFGTTSGATV